MTRSVNLWALYRDLFAKVRRTVLSMKYAWFVPSGRLSATAACGYTSVQCQQQIDHSVHLAGGMSVRLTIWLIALAMRLPDNSLFVVFICLCYKRLKQDQKVVADSPHDFQGDSLLSPLSHWQTCSVVQVQSKENITCTRKNERRPMQVLTIFNHTVLHCIVINYNDILSSIATEEVFGVKLSVTIPPLRS